MKRKMISLFLILALVVAMAVPAFANTYEKEGSRSVNGTSYTYICTTSSTSSLGRAAMTFGHSGSALRCTISATVHYDGMYYYNTGSASGSSSIATSANNYVLANGSYVYGSITYSVGTYYIAGVQVHNRTVKTND